MKLNESAIDTFIPVAFNVGSACRGGPKGPIPLLVLMGRVNTETPMGDTKIQMITTDVIKSHVGWVVHPNFHKGNTIKLKGTHMGEIDKVGLEIVLPLAVQFPCVILMIVGTEQMKEIGHC